MANNVEIAKYFDSFICIFLMLVRELGVRRPEGEKHAVKVEAGALLGSRSLARREPAPSSQLRFSLWSAIAETASADLPAGHPAACHEASAAARGRQVRRPDHRSGVGARLSPSSQSGSGRRAPLPPALIRWLRAPVRSSGRYFRQIVEADLD